MNEKQRDILGPILVLVVISLVLLAIITGITSYRSVYSESINTIRQQNQALANRIDGWIARKMDIVEHNAALLRTLDLSDEMVTAYFAEIAGISDVIFDMYVGFPDGTGLSGIGSPTPEGWLSFERPWYVIAAQSPGEVVFTAPYMDAALNQLVFASVRTVGNRDDSMGVVALTVPLATMADYIAGDNGMPTSFTFILSAGGDILMHPNPAFAPLDDFTFWNKSEVRGGAHASMVKAISDYGFYESARAIYVGGNPIYASANTIYVGTALASTGWHVITRIPTSYITVSVYWTLLSIIATGSVAVVTLVGIGISLRMAKTAMKREREAHAMDEIFFNISPFVMNIWDEDLNLVATSEQSVKMFGLSGQKQYIEQFHKLSPEFQPCGTPSSKKALNYVSEAFRTGSAQFEWLHQTLGGEPLPSEITLVRFTHQGKHKVAAYTTDLRPVIAAIEKEREYEERIRLALDASPMTCFLLDADCKAVDCNQAGIELFVRDPSRTLAATYPDQDFFNDCKLDCKICDRRGLKSCPARNYLVSNYGSVFPDRAGEGEQAGRLITAHCGATLESGTQRLELSCATLYGETIPCEVTIVPVSYHSGRGFGVYLRDLREHIMMLAETQRREIAEEESHAKTRFLARMSHEIRTPMNAVLGIAEIQLQKKGFADKSGNTEEAFLRIYRSASLLLTIINDILDLSKVESGKMEILPTVYDTANLIADIVQLNFTHIDSRKISFNLSIDKDLPSSLSGDELRIKQVLNNLLSNAFKYTQEGAVNLSFGIEAAGGGAADGDALLVITVSDTGQGMTEKQISHLFDEEFIRFNTINNRHIEGTGLGMSIVYSLVKMMNGEIKAESVEGKGTTFTVRLPQRRSGDGVLGAQAVASLQRLESTQEFLKKSNKFTLGPMPYGRVLVVDDMDINLYVAEGILMAYEIAVDLAESGAAAIEKVKSGNDYDIIFMDHMMPDMDGIETTVRLREMGYGGPIVALTANALKDMADVFENNGFSGFISKPIDIEKLNTYLVRFIREKHEGAIPAEARKLE